MNPFRRLRRRPQPPMADTPPAGLIMEYDPEPDDDSPGIPDAELIDAMMFLVGLEGFAAIRTGSEGGDGPTVWTAWQRRGEETTPPPGAETFIGRGSTCYEATRALCEVLGIEIETDGGEA